MKIIFFDGTCPMCNAWVKRIIRWDRKKIFRFSPLEGELAKKTLTSLLPGYITEDTIVYYDDGQVYLRSDAGLKIARELGFPYSLGVIGGVMPKDWRDGIYRYIASRRYTYGKRYDVCPMPPQAWKDRFI